MSALASERSNGDVLEWSWLRTEKADWVKWKRHQKQNTK